METTERRSHVLQKLFNIGGPKEILLLFQAYSCLVLIMLNPPVSISCQQNTQPSHIFNDGTHQQLTGFTWSKQAVENICSRGDNHDSLLHKLVLFVIGFAVTVCVRCNTNRSNNTAMKNLGKIRAFSFSLYYVYYVIYYVI